MDSSSSSSTSSQGRVRLNVGGVVFDTTAATLRAGGPDSLLAAIAAPRERPAFVDRDPDLFSVLLSLLRTASLPSLRRFPLKDLSEEALYYGIEPLLRAAAAPRPLLGFDAAPVAELCPATDGTASAIAPGAEDGSLWLAHGGQISAYDWTLSRAGTLRTHMDRITSLRHAWPEVAAVGSSDSPGLHLYDVARGRHIGAVHWTDAADPRVYKATVTAIAANPGPAGENIYAAFECPHRENCILAVDRATLRPVAEIGRLSGSSTRVAAPTRLVALPGRGLIFAAAVSAGAFGVSGCIRLWDARAGVKSPVWEAAEPGSGRSSARFGDPFADADVDAEEPGAAIWKVCWKSGDVAVADLRMLGEDPWVYLQDRAAAGLRNEGGGGIIRCYKKQIFVGAASGLRVWSPLPEDMSSSSSLGEGYRCNFVDSEAEAARGSVRMMEGGGERLFVCREGVDGVQVWETSDSPQIVPLTD